MGLSVCLSVCVQTSFRRGFVPDCSLFCFDLIAFSLDLCMPAQRRRSIAGVGAGSRCLQKMLSTACTFEFCEVCMYL